MVKDYSRDTNMTDLGCSRQLTEADTWYFWKDVLEDKGWTATTPERVFCGQVSFRSNNAIRLCEDCLRRKGYIW